MSYAYVSVSLDRQSDTEPNETKSDLGTRMWDHVDNSWFIDTLMQYVEIFLLYQYNLICRLSHHFTYVC